MKHINTLDITAADFDIESFDDIVKRIRSTRKTILSIDSDRAEAKERLVEAKAELQEAVDNADYDALPKINATCRRLEARIDENPVEKVQAFDEAIDELDALLKTKPALTAVA